MEKFNFYVTEKAPNGTRDLLISDSNHQIKYCLNEAVFGGHWSPLDKLGNIIVSMSGEDIGLINYEYEELDLESILNGECSEICPVSRITKEELFEHLAVSPIDPNGEQLIKQLNDLGIKE